MGIFQPVLLLNHLSEWMSECRLGFWSVHTWSGLACRLHLSNQPTWKSKATSLRKWTWSFVTLFATWGMQQAPDSLESWPRQCVVVTVKQTSTNSWFLVLVGWVCSAGAARLKSTAYKGLCWQLQGWAQKSSGGFLLNLSCAAQWCAVDHFVGAEARDLPL